jgi:nucleoside-diphosphate-sugar epimerase
MPRRVPDISKLAALIGYEPKVALDDIISRVIAHAREQQVASR